jgi:hypothetical protein
MKPRHFAHKVTHGWVTQVFKDGKCVEQSFFACDEVEWEDRHGETLETCLDENGKEISVEDLPYQTFDMVQPGKEKAVAAAQSMYTALKAILEQGDEPRYLDIEALLKDYSEFAE